MIKRKFYLLHFRKLAMFADIASESFCDVSRWSAEGGQWLVCATEGQLGGIFKHYDFSGNVAINSQIL